MNFAHGISAVAPSDSNKIRWQLMKYIDDLRLKLTAIGGSLYEGEWALICDAPPGYTWNATGATSLTIPVANHSQTWYAQAIRGAADDLAAGLSRVTDPDHLASIRHELGDDMWGAGDDASDELFLKDSK